MVSDYNFVPLILKLFSNPDIKIHFYFLVIVFCFSLTFQQLQLIQTMKLFCFCFFLFHGKYLINLKITVDC